MARSVQLEIVWDGSVKGLADKRVSLAEFGDALALLVKAARRIAHDRISNAIEPSARGRLVAAANNLDIQIAEVKHNSSGFDTIVTFEEMPLTTMPLFGNGFLESVSQELLRSIREESEGHFRNSSVRSYLRALPKGLTRQKYNLHENGRAIDSVEIGDVKLAELPDAPASLREIEGDVVGVVFESGKQEVRVKGKASTVGFSATNEDVEKALAVRKETVRILGVHDGKHARMLRIEAADKPRFVVTPEAIEEHIYKRWANVFERLSK